MQTSSERKYYIDWIRVLAFFLLIFFHCAMPFVVFGWEVKNAETSVCLTRLIWWMHQWRLPLLFFISGVSIHFSLKSRSVLAFAGERFIRLFIPLLFAMFFVIPLQVYFEKLQKGLITGSYLSFYPTVWSFIPYPDGTLSWSHMWFVVYLFVFCLLLLPLFALFKIKPFKIFREKLGLFFSQPVTAFALVVPLAVCYFTLYLRYPEQQSLLDDWFLFLFSLLLLFYGYLLGGSDRFWETCARYRFYFLGIAIACLLFLFFRYWRNMTIPEHQNTDLYLFGTVSAVHIWSVVLAVSGFARIHLNFTNRFLKYANQAVYPFYILHQTLIVAFGYYVVQWKLPIAVKLLILVLLCFTSLVLIYQFLIKPFIVTRILYGLRPKEKKKP